jgi:hypothetical protein
MISIRKLRQMTDLSVILASVIAVSLVAFVGIVFIGLK